MRHEAQEKKLIAQPLLAHDADVLVMHFRRQGSGQFYLWILLAELVRPWPVTVLYPALNETALAEQGIAKQLMRRSQFRI